MAAASEKEKVLKTICRDQNTTKSLYAVTYEAV